MWRDRRSRLHRTRRQRSVRGQGAFSLRRVASSSFILQSMMQRHRMIYGALSEEMQQGLHALSLKTKTPEEASKAAAAQ